LRCAISLADLWLSHGRRSEAIEVLEPAYHLIGEGAGTRDLVKARKVLAAARREEVLH